jgi:hypothetical protein
VAKRLEVIATMSRTTIAFARPVTERRGSLSEPVVMLQVGRMVVAVTKPQSYPR